MFKKMFLIIVCLNINDDISSYISSLKKYLTLKLVDLSFRTMMKQIVFTNNFIRFEEIKETT